MSAHRRKILYLAVTLLGWLTIPGGAYAQSYQCSDCPCLERRGEELEKKDSLTAAIRLYNAAKECDPSRTLEMNRCIEAIFAKIDGIRNQAIKDDLAARNNITRTAALQKQAKQDAAEAERQKNIALAAKAAADTARVLAEAGRRAADSLEIVFKEQEGKTRQTLARLDKALDDLAREYTRQATRQIYQLNYDSAQILAGKASALRRDFVADSLQGLFLELVYVYSEAEQLVRIKPLIDSLALWYSRPMELNGNLDERRKALAMLDSARFKVLERRYYPEMVMVPGGSFLMGISKETRKQLINTFGLKYVKTDVEDWTWDEMPAHKVSVDSFYIAQTETTCWQYVIFCIANRFERPQTLGGDHPVLINWNDAQSYLTWLNKQKQKYYRLPTEAEWEYAARGGQEANQVLSFFEDIDYLAEVAWYEINSNNNTHPVGQKKHNTIGLYDMLGNVWEWCSDAYSYYDTSVGSVSFFVSELYILRGGAWRNNEIVCRSTYRSKGEPNCRPIDEGFRVCLK